MPVFAIPNKSLAALIATLLFVIAALVAFALKERDAGLILVGFAGGTGLVGRKE